MAKKQAADDWCSSQPACRGNLGKSRSEMPQIPEGEVPDFLAWLESKGIVAHIGRMAVGELSPTQREINNDKVEDMRGSVDTNKPILVSEDNYVLDGHHRWAALLVDDPMLMIRVIKVHTPIEVLLEMGNNFPGSHQRDIDDKPRAVAASNFDLLARTVAWRFLLS